MGFVTNISDFGSLAIVGLEKNTGKTECLNYILGQLGGQAERFALTSVGIDGESRDQVCQTAKPEIEIPEGMIFVTSEKHYREKRLAAEVLDVSLERTALGRLITARARMSGKLLLSGPSDTAGLKALIDRLKARGVGTTIVDGALSRLSLASRSQSSSSEKSSSVSPGKPTMNVERTARSEQTLRQPAMRAAVFSWCAGRRIALSTAGAACWKGMSR